MCILITCHHCGLSTRHRTCTTQRVIQKYLQRSLPDRNEPITGVRFHGIHLSECKPQECSTPYCFDYTVPAVICNRKALEPITYYKCCDGKRRSSDGEELAPRLQPAIYNQVLDRFLDDRPGTIDVWSRDAAGLNEFARTKRPYNFGGEVRPSINESNERAMHVQQQLTLKEQELARREEALLSKEEEVARKEQLLFLVRS